MSRLTFLMAGAAMAVALSCTAADAASVTVTASAPNDAGIWRSKAISVSLDDVDMTVAAGGATALERITKASHVVCGEIEGHTMNASRQSQFDKCVAQAIRYAVGSVNIPTLTEAAAH